jgi:hypothetical protein
VAELRPPSRDRGLNLEVSGNLTLERGSWRASVADGGRTIVLRVRIQLVDLPCTPKMELPMSKWPVCQRCVNSVRTSSAIKMSLEGAMDPISRCIAVIAETESVSVLQCYSGLCE